MPVLKNTFLRELSLKLISQAPTTPSLKAFLHQKLEMYIADRDLY